MKHPLCLLCTTTTHSNNEENLFYTSGPNHPSVGSLLHGYFFSKMAAFALARASGSLCTNEFGQLVDFSSVFLRLGTIKSKLTPFSDFFLC